MAQTVVVNFTRRDQSQPWGFRLQGGKDFASPLSVLKVNPGSPAEIAGLQVGDCVIRVNSVEVADLKHAEALEVIKQAGNSFELLVCRGGIWKPQVTPLAEPVVSNGDLLFRKTSLAANKPQEVHHIGSAHNTRAAPFQAAKVVDEPSTGLKLVNKQYNSPAALYNEQTIAETLSAQAEVLAQGVLGVNFKKNEKTYDASSSSVFKALQEFDKEPKEPTPPEGEEQPSGTGSEIQLPSGMRRVAAPVAKPQSESSPQPAVHTRCAECDRLVVGVFVRIKDKNLHVECFKCTICGTSLKNCGYYNINDKLYCDIHARQVARQQPPASNLEPVTVNPGNPLPQGAFPAETAKRLASPSVGPGNVAAQQKVFSPMALGNMNPPPVGGVRIFPPSPASLGSVLQSKVQEQSHFSESKSFSQTKISSSASSSVSSSTLESFSSKTSSSEMHS